MSDWYVAGGAKSLLVEAPRRGLASKAVHALMAASLTQQHAPRLANVDEGVQSCGALKFTLGVFAHNALWPCGRHEVEVAFVNSIPLAEEQARAKRLGWVHDPGVISVRRL